MSRVLLVCPEPLGHRQPAGIGVRFLEMARVLRADGHNITVLSRDSGSVAGCQSDSLAPESLARHSSAADVAVVQGHAANDLFVHGRPIPTVIDLYDPFIIENLHYYSTRGADVFQHDHATLMQSLLRGDLFLCASQSQRLFYLGLLLAVGRLSPLSFDDDPHLDDLLRIAPFGVQPLRKLADRRGNAILFGGIYDWYDPIRAIDAAAIARRSFPDLTLTFTLHPNPDLTPQGKTAEAVSYVKKRGYGDFVRFEPWIPYEERGDFFDRFKLALITFPQSIETDLSMRTRVYDYLWGGLPIVTSPAPGTDELIALNGVGLVIVNDSAEAFAEEIEVLLHDQSRYHRMAAATQVFAREHQWPSVLQPLRDYCRAPKADRNKEAFAARLDLAERPASVFDRIKRRIGGAF